MADVTCIADLHMILGEGPVWVEREQALYWLDIKGRKIYRRTEDGERIDWPTPFRVGSIVPRANGGFIAGTDEGIALIDLDTPSFEIVANPEKDLPDNRFNDGKVDRAGRFWAGTMDDRQRGSAGSLYRIDPGLSCTAIDGGYSITNGPAFSPDGRLMYHSDTARQVTYVYDLAADGSVANRRVFRKFEQGDGYPDGMTVDSEGCLWIAFWGGWCIRRFSADGDMLEKIDMPVEQPSSCVFGGPDLDRLYVTSATQDLDAAALAMQPNAGGLFLLCPGVRGLAERPFAG